MAELLLARTAPTEHPVVLKWVRPEHAIDSEFLETFLGEGRRAAQLQHPNIVQVHEVGREDGTYYLSMDYVHGDDVRKLLARLHERRAKLPVQHIISIVTAVAAAIHHAHEQAIEGGTLLHLDIKPSNVIIAVDGTVKVTDFGIARAALLEGRSDLLRPIAGYLSPEQVTGGPIDRRTDVFGIGILMYELATGRRLFKGDNDFVTMSAIVAGDIPPPTRNRGDLPKELEVIIMKALARAPEDRYQTVLELQGAIDSFAAKAGVRGSLTTLSGFTKRLFGVRPEPWLVDDEIPDFSTMGDFDGAPRGLATAPVQASHSALPDSVNATASSPIHRIMKQVSREMPTEQLTLAKLAGSAGSGTPPDKSAPVQIPAAATSGRAKAPTRVPAPAPAAVRARPKTVQIPVHAVVAKDERTEVTVPPSSNVIGRVEADTFADDTTIAEPQSTRRALITESADDTNEMPMRSNGRPANGVAAKPLLPLTELAKQLPQPNRPLPSASAPAPRPPVPRPPVVVEPARVEPPPETRADETTAVANPPPMVSATTTPRDATEIVKALPPPPTTQLTAAQSSPSKKSTWMIVAVAAGAAVVALVVMIGFSGDDAAPAPDVSAAKDPATVAKAAPDEPTPLGDPGAGPRTPRNSFAPTRPVEPVAAEPVATEPAAIAPTPIEPAPIEPAPTAPAPTAPVTDPPPPREPPPPKFVEPVDPAPPEPVTTKPAKPAKRVATKPVPKPKPKAKPAPKPTKLAVKPTPKPTPATKKPTKPAPTKWDPNALFPK